MGGEEKEAGGWLGELAGGTGETLRTVFVCLVIKKLNKKPLSKHS